MLDRVYVRATSTERRHVACAGLKFFFHNDSVFGLLKKERRKPFPCFAKNTTANRPKIGLYSLGKDNRLVLNKHLSGIKKPVVYSSQ